MKVNVDASFDESIGCGSVGTIIRNSAVAVIAGSHSVPPSSGCAHGRGVCLEGRYDASACYWM